MLSRDKICSLMYGIRMVYLETFLLVYMRVLRHLMQECTIFWDFDATGNIPVQATTGRPVAESGDRSRDTIPTPRFLRRPSAKDSFNPMEGKSLKNFGADQQRLQISELHFDKFPTPQTFSCWKIIFKIEVCSCSNFPMEAMLWMKEMEMVTSVGDLNSSCSLFRDLLLFLISSCSTRGLHLP